DVLCALCREEQGVGTGVQVIGDAAVMQDDAADLVTEGGATRLAGQQRRPAAGSKPLREVTRRGRLAAAIGPLEGDEPSTACAARHLPAGPSARPGPRREGARRAGSA